MQWGRNEERVQPVRHATQGLEFTHPAEGEYVGAAVAVAVAPVDVDVGDVALSRVCVEVWDEDMLLNHTPEGGKGLYAWR